MMTDDKPMGEKQGERDEPSIPQSGPEGPPTFDEPERPAPEVTDAPGRNTEF